MTNLLVCINKMKRIFKILIIAIIILTAYDCKSLFHDNYNPCTPGTGQNNVDCDNWKKNFPKEYIKYKKRHSGIIQ